MERGIYGCGKTDIGIIGALGIPGPPAFDPRPSSTGGRIQWGEPPRGFPPWPGGGGLVVADLTGFASAVYKEAAHARRRSVTPPLPIEAAASIGGKVPRALFLFQVSCIIEL